MLILPCLDNFIATQYFNYDITLQFLMINQAEINILYMFLINAPALTKDDFQHVILKNF